MSKKRLLVLDVIAITILVLLDQFTKALAISHLKGTEGIDLINGVLKLYYLPNGNSGAAFGILSGHRSLFLIIAVLVALFIFLLLSVIPYEKKYRLLRILLVFIAAGGIGNMIDRMISVSVVDFIYFYLINFPIFNVADCYVSVATVILAVLLLFVYKEDELKPIEDSLKSKFVRKEKNN